MPRGRPLKPVDADASCAARLGAAIRGMRVAQNLTLHALASRIGYSSSYISDVELAQVSASKAFVTACDRALDAGGRLVALYPAVAIEQLREREHRANRRRAAGTLDDDVKRRAFLGLGLAVVLLGPEAVARANADDWERIAHAWSYEITTAPDRSALLPGLLSDLKRLSANGGPQRTITQLSSHVAMIAVSGGDVELARRWFRRAQVAAKASGDTQLQAGVMGLHAVEGVFGMHAPGRVLALANRTLAITDASCIGRQRALSARVRALALQGRKRETRDALTVLEQGFERLPRDITREKIAVNGWTEEDLHNVTSFASAFVGVDGGEAASHAKSPGLPSYAKRCTPDLTARLRSDRIGLTTASTR